MSIIQAYKSDEDGKVFEFKADYTKHLRKLGAKRREAKRIEQCNNNREAFFDEMGQVASFNELEQFIKDNWDFFRTNGNILFKERRKKSDDNLISLTLKINTFHQSFSNSHSSPRKGKNNWGRKVDDGPTGYPGWRARISFSVTYSSNFGSSYFDRTPICTGTGGGGDDNLSYDLTLWASDFPVIWEKHCRDNWMMRKNQERQHTWRSLGGKGLCTPVTEADIPSDWVCPDPITGV